jgi:hypothetical protein
MDEILLALLLFVRLALIPLIVALALAASFRVRRWSISFWLMFPIGSAAWAYYLTSPIQPMPPDPQLPPYEVGLVGGILLVIAVFGAIVGATWRLSTDARTYMWAHGRAGLLSPSLPARCSAGHARGPRVWTGPGWYSS